MTSLLSACHSVVHTDLNSTQSLSLESASPKTAKVVTLRADNFVTESFGGFHKVSVGDRIEFVLPTEPEKGIKWQAAVPPTGILKQVGRPIIRPNSSGQPHPYPSQEIVWTYRAVSRGKIDAIFNFPFGTHHYMPSNHVWVIEVF